MKVALVQRNSPLEIVTNLHSKRKTEQLILFDRGTRFYGADASSVMARKPLQAPEAMSVMLGRGDDHPFVQVRKTRGRKNRKWRGYVIVPFDTCNFLSTLAKFEMLYCNLGFGGTSLSFDAKVQ